MLRFFYLFGVTGRFLPMLSVVAILLCWHIARKDRWQVKPATVVLMYAESVLLCVPLLVFRGATIRWGVSEAVHISWKNWENLAISSIGAGIYEELVFRLIGLTVLHLFLVDLCKIDKAWSNLLMVVGAAVLFSAYHYLGSEPWDLRIFFFRVVAGIYFGAIFLTRGFGITAGAHAGYDVVLACMMLGHG
jgi:membrane protease YdiL (CAAX protease family)